MRRGKVPKIINTSNQANICEAEKTELSQHNIVVLLGLNYLSQLDSIKTTVPISINIKKDGEIELYSLDENMLKEDNIRIYSDTKISHT